jgi:hypothetical protein
LSSTTFRVRPFAFHYSQPPVAVRRAPSRNELSRQRRGGRPSSGLDRLAAVVAREADRIRVRTFRYAVVDREKKAKLLEKLCSQFKKLGVNAQPEQLILPWDESTAASKGCAPLSLLGASRERHVQGTDVDELAPRPAALPSTCFRTRPTPPLRSASSTRPSSERTSSTSTASQTSSASPTSSLSGPSPRRSPSRPRFVVFCRLAFSTTLPAVHLLTVRWFTPRALLTFPGSPQEVAGRPPGPGSVPDASGHDGLGLLERPAGPDGGDPLQGRPVG